MNGDSASSSSGSSQPQALQRTTEEEFIEALADRASVTTPQKKEPGKKVLKFERLEGRGNALSKPAIHRIFYRKKIAGGWLLVPDNSVQAPFFIPDPKHKWDGNSLP